MELGLKRYLPSFMMDRGQNQTEFLGVVPKDFSFRLFRPENVSPHAVRVLQMLCS